MRKQREGLDLDSILREIGEFGKYQIVTICIASLTVIFAGFGSSEYIFTARALNHRCLVPECDRSNVEYEPGWRDNAIPANEQCARYTPSSNSSADDCPASLFSEELMPCEDYVHESTTSAVYDFGLECEEWKRSVIGTTGSIGTFFALPLTGFISDRWGRRVALVFNAVSRAFIGLLRSWSVNYEMFIILELAESTFGSGAFSACYLLATELVGPSYRVIAGATMNSFFAIGQVILGLIAWAVPEWRTLTRILYTPQFLILAYYWLIYESVRWLLSKRKFAEAETILIKAAKSNKKQISQNSLNKLKESVEEEAKEAELAKSLPQEKEELLIVKVFKSNELIIRCCTAPIWWMTTTLVYYGLSINSVSLNGNMYVNFILVTAIEIPGYWTAVVLLDKIGRKKTFSMTFLLCSTCCFIFPFIPTELSWLSLALYMAGKFFISMVMTSVYVYTAELFPTQYRHSLLGFSSMMGRVGAIVAPLTPALMVYWQPIPTLIFAVMALISGCLVFITPETMNTKLPDTIEQAEQIGAKEIECT